MTFRQIQFVEFVVLSLTVSQLGPAAGQVPEARPNQITPDAVRKVKQATVYLKVTNQAGATAEGSGFLAIEPGVVITNAHVLGMLESNGKPPSKITVVVYSGEANEMSLTATILGVDRSNDLAILRVPGNLPLHLQLDLKEELFETQKVYIFGFPFGAELGKNITVSESSVSSLRKDASGTLERVQVNGGMHPGNSGGPVVNAVGQVVGVSVSGLRATQINFAIPASTVKSLLDGRIQDVKAGVLFQRDAEVRVPLRYECLDPFQRIREIRVEVWPGQPAASRAFSTSKAQPEAGDGRRQSVALKYAESSAATDLLLPKLAEGEVAWVQPVVVFVNGESHWGRPQAFDATLAVERKPASLLFKLADNKERTVHLRVSQSLTLIKGKSKRVLAETAELDMVESFGPDPKGALVRTAFGVPRLKREVDDKKEEASAEVAGLLQRIPPRFIVDETNKLRNRVETSLGPRVPTSLREQVADYLAEICNGYESANFIIPNRQVRALETWRIQMPMLLKTGGKPEVIDLDMTGTYEGSRIRPEGPEALVSFEGRVTGRNALKDKVVGNVVGKFTFDVNRGFISSAKTTITSEASLPGGEIDLVSTFDVDLTRAEGNLKGLDIPLKTANSGAVAKAPSSKAPDPRGAGNAKPPVKPSTPMPRRPAEPAIEIQPWKEPPTPTETPVVAQRIDRKELALPSPVDGVCAGGAGRFLILHLPKERKIAIFDANESKIVKYLPVAEDNIKFAAGLDTLIVALPTSNVLQRWSLNTLERETTVSNPIAEKINGLAMGSASSGPLVVNTGPSDRRRFGELRLLDPRTFNESFSKPDSRPGFRHRETDVRVSASGQVIVTPAATWVLEGQNYKTYSGVGGALPGPDGRTLFTRGQLYTAEGTPLGQRLGGHGQAVWYVPALNGSLYCALKEARETPRGKQFLRPAIHTVGEFRPIITLEQLDATEGLVNWVTGAVKPLDQHIFLNPDARLLIVVPATNDKLVLYRFDFEQLLAKSEVDYLFVQSQPVTIAIKNQSYEYQLAIRSKKGGVKIAVDDSPAGMKVTPEGKLTWNVPKEFPEVRVNVLLTVSDASGQEIFHSFKITVRDHAE